MERDRMIHILGQLAEDAEADVREFEGDVVTGHIIADFNGKQNAMIQALATILRRHIIDTTKEET